MTKEMYIYVMEERWVVVGVVISRSMCGMKTILGKSATVRVWGTTKGLGELARLGPRGESTKLDEEPNGVEINEGYVMRKIPCDYQMWKKWLEGDAK